MGCGEERQEEAAAAQAGTEAALGAPKSNLTCGRRARNTTGGRNTTAGVSALARARARPANGHCSHAEAPRAAPHTALVPSPRQARAAPRRASLALPALRLAPRAPPKARRRRLASDRPRHRHPPRCVLPLPSLPHLTSTSALRRAPISPSLWRRPSPQATSHARPRAPRAALLRARPPSLYARLAQRRRRTPARRRRLCCTTLTHSHDLHLRLSLAAPLCTSLRLASRPLLSSRTTLHPPGPPSHRASTLPAHVSRT